MGIGYNPQLVTNGLVLCLDAANARSYSGSGNTWFDLSGNGNNFTLYNTPTHDGRKLTFNGTNQYAECINTTCGDFGTSGFSIEYCMNVASASTTGSLIMKRNAITSIGVENARGWAHRCGVSFFAQDNNTGGLRANAAEISSPAVDNFGSIAHNLMTISRSGLNYTMNFYINNVLRGTKSGTFVGDGDITRSFATTILYTRGENVYTAGDVHFVRMYNKALSAAEIQQNYNALRGRFGI